MLHAYLEYEGIWRAMLFREQVLTDVLPHLHNKIEYCSKIICHLLPELNLLFKGTMSLLQPTSNSAELWIMNMSCMSYLWNLNVSSVLIFKLCKETRLLARLHCQTLLSDWLAFFFIGNNIPVHEKSCKGYMSICSTSITHFLWWPRLNWLNLCAA